MTLCKSFLDYMASQEEAVLTYKASDMELAIHSDGSQPRRGTYVHVIKR